MLNGIIEIDVHGKNVESAIEEIRKHLNNARFTHREMDSTEQIRFTNENPVTLLEKLKSGEVIPTLLGSGIRLFGNALSLATLGNTQNRPQKKS